ncbi:hypothetical protein ACS0TY_031907 [Phlomoides rotata]
MSLFLLYSLFSVIHPEPPFKLCDSPKFPDNSPYEASLDNLLSSMRSTPAPVPKFNKTSIGTQTNRIYGLFLCYSYSPQDECQTCIRESLPQNIRRLCDHKYEAVVWDEYCLFHYSTQNIFGQLNVTVNIPLYNKKNISDPETFRSVVNKTLHDLTKLAAFNSSYEMHSSGSTSFTGNTTLYAFVQCSQDLSPSNCSTCLESAIENILPYYFSRGGRLLSSSCFLRYELYAFYDGQTESDSQTNQTSEPKAGKRIENWKIAVVALGSGIIALLALGCCLFYTGPQIQTKRHQDVEIHGRDDLHFADNGFGKQHNLDPMEYPFIEMKTIAEATDNFSDYNKLGEGGFGPVFKGILPDGQEIAVKRMSINSEQGSDEFVNEVLLIHKLQHVNLVKLLGFSGQDEEKLLIYEYMPNSSLDGYLWDSRKRTQLNWSKRINIIKGVSRGMLYLHQDSRLKIIHRDLKPSNVLLDALMNPKISDFGMARIFGGNDGEANTAKIVGTYGYMAPEFAMEGVYSIKSDVYSFGVLLLEIITARRNAGFHVTGLGPSLLAYAWKLWNEGRGLELMDPLLADSCPSKEEFTRCLHIGLLCVQEDASDRPSMSSIVLMLNRDTVSLSQPERPAFTDRKFIDHYQTCFNRLSINDLTMSDLLPR